VAKDEILAFLGPKVISKEKPVITAHYGGSFNHVDRLNGRRSNLRYIPTVKNQNTLALISMLEMAAIQTYSLKRSWIEDEETDFVALREFVEELAADLSSSPN